MPNQFTAGWTNEETESLKEYVNKGFSNKEISELMGRSYRSITVRLSKLGITRPKKTYDFQNKEWLIQKYCNEEYSSIDIAKMCNVHFTTVIRWLKKFDIEVRDFYHRTERQRGKIANFQKTLTLDKSPNWRGGKTKTHEGYVYLRVKEHPHQNKNGCVLEHRLNMEKKLGRYLEPEEVVHHMNEIKDDNEPDNLFLFATGRDHKHYHEQVKKNPNFPLEYKYDYLHEKEIVKNVK